MSDKALTDHAVIGTENNNNRIAIDH